MRAKELLAESRQPGEYVYHASFVGDDQGRWLRNLTTKGLQPSRTGYSGPGTYFAYEPNEGYYHVGPDESKLLRVKWADLVELYGVYPENKQGIQRTDDEIIVPGPVPGRLLEVEYFEDEWWDLESAYRAETRPITEFRALLEAVYAGNIGMMEMVKFFKVATDQEKLEMKSLIAAGRQEEAWELLKRVTGVALKEQTVDEAEQGTPQAKEISQILSRAGYKMLGSGADATVWAQDTGSVVKIIMPEEAGTKAAETFKRFYQFAREHQNLDCMPRFLELDKSGPAKFSIKGKDYFLVAMERLTPIKDGSFEQGLVYLLSDYVIKKTPWEQVKDNLSKPDTWHDTEYFSKQANQFARTAANFTPKQEAEYSVLYAAMVLLYHTGRINRLGWDLHTENAMMRGRTIVIIDPWFELEENK